MRGKSIHATRGAGSAPRICVRLSPETLETVQRVAREEGKSVSDILRRWIDCRAADESWPI